MSFEIGISPNIRKSPYFSATVAEGVRSFSVYNHMYIPAHFGDPVAEYKRLTESVAMWDVGAQRQVEISGPDACSLVQYLCARDVSRVAVGQGRYAPVCNHDGLLINDPVMLRVAENRFWLSIADSDIGLWAEGIARERGMVVEITEPDVSPMAVQGPKADDVIADLLGDWTRTLRHFQFKSTRLDGIPLVLARSGWSRQGGFELYLEDGSLGTELWDRVRSAGCLYGIGPGAPNDLERLESGLLSYGADARLQVSPANPLELGLDRYIDLDSKDEFIGKSALQRIRKHGVTRKLHGYYVEGEQLGSNQHPLPVLHSGQVVGSMSEMAWSGRLQKNIAIGLVSTSLMESEDLSISLGEGDRTLVPTSIPFVRCR